MVDPDVLDAIWESLEPPAATLNDPSLVTLPSTSVPVNVIDPPFDDVVSEILMIPAALTVTPVAPDVLDKITDDDAPPAPTPNVPSLVTLPSTSVPVMVIFPDDADNVTIPPAVNVTSDPVDEFNVTGDDVPVNVKSVPTVTPTKFTSLMPQTRNAKTFKPVVVAAADIWPVMVNAVVEPCPPLMIVETVST